LALGTTSACLICLDSVLLIDNISTVDGLIKTAEPVDVFLLNPNGIIFGPSAELSIEGSFVASTASRLQFADNSVLDADAVAPSQLTVSVPIGLQLTPSSGTIQVQNAGHSLSTTGNSSNFDASSTASGLATSAGNTLALVGNGVLLEGGKAKQSQQAGARQSVLLHPISF